MCILLSIKIHSESKIKCPQKVTAVPRPQQAIIGGQLVVYRTDSGQEVRNKRISSHLLLLPITTEDPPITTTTVTTVAKIVFAVKAKCFEKFHFKNQ